jgi:hypothetical protein
MKGFGAGMTGASLSLRRSGDIESATSAVNIARGTKSEPPKPAAKALGAGAGGVGTG